MFRSLGPNLRSIKTYSENVLNFRISSSPLPKTECMIILFRKPSSEIVKFWAPGLEFFGPGQYDQIDKAVNLTTSSVTNFHLLIDKLPLNACRSLFGPWYSGDHRGMWGCCCGPLVCEGGL